MTQLQKQKQQTKQTEPETEPTEARDLTNTELAEDVDELLDEIDSVLEENAEEWVASFRQRGGQ